MDIIIECATGSNQKYKYDEKFNLFRLHKVLPPPLVFPFPFGFIPGTRGEDGDPLDVFAISEFEGFTGCIMECRIIGCITMEQQSNGKLIRNDRFLGVPEQSDQYSEAETLEDLKMSVVSLLENFLVACIKLEGKAAKVTGKLDASEALALIDKT